MGNSNKQNLKKFYDNEETKLTLLYLFERIEINFDKNEEEYTVDCIYLDNNRTKRLKHFRRPNSYKDFENIIHKILCGTLKRLDIR